MKTVKKSVLLYLFCSVILLAAGCSPKGEQPKIDQEDVTRETTWNNIPNYVVEGTSSEDGYYYFQDGQYLSFMDTATQKSVVLCNKVGCNHDDGQCYAYVDMMNPFVFLVGDSLYTVEGHNSRYGLIRRGLDGSNREVVLNLLQDKVNGENSVEVGEFKASGHTLYFVGTVTKMSENGGTVRDNAIYMVDLLDYEEQEICPLGENFCEIIAANEEQIIYDEWISAEATATMEEYESGKYQSKEYLSSNQMQIKLWDRESNTTKLLLEDNRWELLSGIAAYEDSLYYIRWEEEHTKNSVYKLSLKDGESQPVYDADGVIGNFVAIDEETIMLKVDGQGWKMFCLQDFEEKAVDFLPEESDIIQSTPDGYVIKRTLEKEGSGNTFFTKQSAYSYISKEDAEKGEANFTDFYIQTFD